jgi:hypothetical protein
LLSAAERSNDVMRFLPQRLYSGLCLVMGVSLTCGMAFSPLYGLSASAKPKQPVHVVKHGAKTSADTSKIGAKTPASNLSYSDVAPLSLLKAPTSYLNKGVSFDATFNSFSSLGLDYKKAMRDSKDYVSLIIRRPDVDKHVIPLAELKLFFPRKKAEEAQYKEIMQLETGDEIRVQGSVFSAALNEPWVDIQDIKIVKKLKPAKVETSDASKPKADSEKTTPKVEPKK